MKFAARASAKRLLRHSLRVKSPRRWRRLTNPWKAAYYRVYDRTTLGWGTLPVLSVLIASVLFILLHFSHAHGSGVQVHGYYKSNGTYVAPYTRKAPHSSSLESQEPSSSHISPPSENPYPRIIKEHRSLKASGVPRDKRGRIKRSAAAKREFMRKTGYPEGRPGYVVDHVVALKHGGKDEPANMQWQTVEAAKEKDRWE